MSEESSLDPIEDAATTALIFPIANDFSPGTPAKNPIKLQVVLRLIEGLPSRDAQVEALRNHYFSDAAAKQTDAGSRLLQQRQLASNVLIGMDSYKVYDQKDAKITLLGKQLLDIASEEDASRLFARHILLDLHGIEVLRILRLMSSSGRPLHKASLAIELNRNGFLTKSGKPLPTSSKNHLIYLAWLRYAGVLPTDGYAINDAVFREIVGASVDDANKALELTDRQKIFAAALRRDHDVNGARDVFSREIVALCQATHPNVFGKTDDLRRAVIAPLIKDGWITHSETAGSRSVSRGRGGASGTVRATEQLASVDPGYLGLRSLAGIPSEVRKQLRKPLNETMEQLKSVDTGVKGLALEALAVRILYELGLTPVAFRERGSENDGAEVDLIAEGVDTHYHRWMVQCKNVAKVHVAALAKEIGMAVIYRAQVILLITTGEFTATVRQNARQLAETSGLQAILVDKSGLAVYVTEGPIGLFRYFERSAQEVLEWKLPQLDAKVKD